MEVDTSLLVQLKAPEKRSGLLGCQSERVGGGHSSTSVLLSPLP